MIDIQGLVNLAEQGADGIGPLADNARSVTFIAQALIAIAEQLKRIADSQAK